MVIISHKAIREFAVIHPNLLTALERWYAITTNADWQGFSDIKKQFNSVDAIGDGLFVFNIDTIHKDFTIDDQLVHSDGYLEVFCGEGDHWSFIEGGEEQRVLRTTEKVRVSDFCSNGLYYFKQIDNFFDAYNEMIESNELTAGEFYIAPMYNYLIQKGKSIKYKVIDTKSLISCGTPSEYLLATGDI